MSSDSDEELAVYGTPLEPLEEDAIPRKKAIGIEDQVAKDKHGRRRFHGAFTGGFSAGFFNSVGSLEGWKPSQFKSSRSSRTNAQSQRAEDFMDDEDMGEFGIAPKVLRPTGDYNQGSGDRSRKRSLMQVTSGPIPGTPVLQTLFEPVRETIGIRLLKKMGWKPGQGVGPRVSKPEKMLAKKQQKSKKVYGCALPNQEEQATKDVEEDSDEDEEYDESVLFAPDEFEPYVVKPKSDCFGLGYSGLDKRPVLSSHIDLFSPPGPSLVMQEKNKKVSIRGQAFGVGAFEKDDEDIYAKDDMSQYDFALDTPQMLAEKRRQEKNSRQIRQISTSTDVLEGFELSSTPVVRKTYPPPPRPQGFVPMHHTKQSRFSVPTTSLQGRSQMSRLTALERAVIVNEPPPNNQQPKKKNELQKEQIQVERTSSGVFKPFVADPEKQERYEKFLTLSKSGQSDKLRSLQPFTMTEWECDREKCEFEQASRLYKPLSAAFSDRFVSASQPDDSTDPLAPVERTKCADDDVKNAAKMKMFGKLTRRIDEWRPHAILCKRFNIPQPGTSNTSSMKAKSSRPKFSIFNFLDAAPFNAPRENVENSSSDNLEVDNLEINTIDKINAIDNSTSSQAGVEKEGVIDEKMEVEVKSKEDDLVNLIDSTNKMDLYKAIFLSSSDESGDEDEKTEVSTKVPPASETNILRNNSPPRGIFANLDFDSINKKPTAVQDKTPKEVNILRNTSPPRGIFANLDAITSQENNISTRHDNQNTTDGSTSQNASLPSGKFSVGQLNKNNQETKIKENDQQVVKSLNPQEDDNSVYGPSLPKTIPQLSRVNLSTKDSSSESEDEEQWVEKSDSSDIDDKSLRHSSKKKKSHSKKSHRKSKKHKEKKHKHKKKKR